MFEEFDDKLVKTKINGKTWLKLFSYIKEYRKQLITGLLSVVIVALTETIMVLFLSKKGLATFIDNDFKTSELVLFIVGMILLIIIEGLAVKKFLYTFSTLERLTNKKLTQSLFIHLQELDYTFYDKYSVGWLISRTTSDTSRVSETISWGFNDIVYATIKLIFILIIMLTISPKLALIMLIIVPLIIFVAVVFKGAIVKYSWIARKINSKVSGSLNEGINGAKTSKSLVLEQKNYKDFSNLVHSYRNAAVKSRLFSSLFFQVVSILTALGISLMAYNGGIMVLDGQIEYDTLFLFVSYTMMFFDPVLTIAFVMNDMKQAQVAADRVFNLMDVEPIVQDSKEVIEKYGNYDHKKVENYEPLNGDIEFKNVTFAYNSTNKIILDDFNLKVKAGTSVALVGETGAGKSTIVNLLSRFYEPTKGEILIDGTEYRKRSIYWLHSNLGYVIQTPHLFSGTIKENVKYGNLDASDEEVIRACKIANAHEFIEKLENGYDTEVGEGGNRLSQGQKQLISFARAIIADPRILILDEATSSIDTETESVIQKAIHNILKNRTSFIVAHRLSTIVDCDIILVIRGGKIVEQGNHEELLKLKGYYYKLYTNQFIEEQTNSIIN